MAETATQTPYRIKAHWLETCNCDPGCNCNFGGFPDHGGCEFICGIEVAEGSCGGVDLTGVQAVMAGKFPKALHEGQGQGVVFIDASVRQDQIEGMMAILSGKLGGLPWEILGTETGLYDTCEEPILKPIEMTIDGRRSHFRFPDVL